MDVIEEVLEEGEADVAIRDLMAAVEWLEQLAKKPNGAPAIKSNVRMMRTTTARLVKLVASL